MGRMSKKSSGSSRQHACWQWRGARRVNRGKRSSSSPGPPRQFRLRINALIPSSRRGHCARSPTCTRARVDAADFRCLPIGFFRDEAVTHSLHIKSAVARSHSSASLDAGNRSNLGIGAKQERAVQVIERSPWRSAPAALRSLIRIRRDFIPNWTNRVSPFGNLIAWLAFSRGAAGLRL